MKKNKIAVIKGSWLGEALQQKLVQFKFPSIKELKALNKAEREKVVLNIFKSYVAIIQPLFKYCNIRDSLLSVHAKQFYEMYTEFAEGDLNPEASYYYTVLDQSKIISASNMKDLVLLLYKIMYGRIPLA